MPVLEKIRTSLDRHPALTLAGTPEGPAAKPTRFALDEEIVSIGRTAANRIRLDNGNISKRHCLLVKTPQGVKVVDLESTNGCWVNDDHVRERVLSDGDRLRVGPYTFVFSAGRFVPPAEPVISGDAAVTNPFADNLVAELKRTPFWLISGVVHGILILLLWHQGYITLPAKKKAIKIQANSEVREALDEIVEEPVPLEETIDDPTIDSDFEPDAPPESTEPEARDRTDAELDEPDGTIGMLGRSGRAAAIGGGVFDGRGLERALGGTRFAKRVAELRGRGLDVCIVFDSTGSMGEIIDEVRKQIRSMNTYISALVGDYRLAMVTYRDRTDDYLTKVEPFTTDYYRILNFLETVNAAGGYDIPEAVYAGLKVAMEKLRWRRNADKVILLFGDAPPHDREVQACLSLAGRFRRRHGTIHTIYTEIGANKRTLDADGQKAVRAFESIARYGGGSFNFLDQEAAIIRELQALIFGKEYREDIARVEGQLDYGWQGRLIAKKVAKRDVNWLVDAFTKRDRVHPLIVQGLIELRDESVGRRLDALLERNDLDDEKRSAIEYVMRKRRARG